MNCEHYVVNSRTRVPSLEIFLLQACTDDEHMPDPRSWISAASSISLLSLADSLPHIKQQPVHTNEEDLGFACLIVGSEPPEGLRIISVNPLIVMRYRKERWKPLLHKANAVCDTAQPLLMIIVQWVRYTSKHCLLTIRSQDRTRNGAHGWGTEEGSSLQTRKGHLTPYQFCCQVLASTNTSMLGTFLIIIQFSGH